MKKDTSLKTPSVGIMCLVVVVGLLPLLSATGALAEMPFYVGFKGGIYSPQSSGLDGYDAGFSREIMIGYRFSLNIAAEFGFGYFETRGKQTYVGAGYTRREEFDIDILPLVFTLKGILPYKKWEVFGLGGAGVYVVSGPFDIESYDQFYFHYSEGDYDVDAVLGVHVGGGLHYYITPRIFVGAEGKYLWTEKARLRGDVSGKSMEATFKLNGFIASGVIGVRF